jgi:hypothetical protein
VSTNLRQKLTFLKLNWKEHFINSTPEKVNQILIKEVDRLRANKKSVATCSGAPMTENRRRRKEKSAARRGRRRALYCGQTN